jgi:hypothetical protein
MLLVCDSVLVFWKRVRVWRRGKRVRRVLIFLRGEEDHKTGLSPLGTSFLPLSFTSSNKDEVRFQLLLWQRDPPPGNLEQRTLVLAGARARERERRPATKDCSLSRGARSLSGGRAAPSTRGCRGSALFADSGGVSWPSGACLVEESEAHPPSAAVKREGVQTPKDAPPLSLSLSWPGRVRASRIGPIIAPAVVWRLKTSLNVAPVCGSTETRSYTFFLPLPLSLFVGRLLTRSPPFSTTTNTQHQQCH